MATQTPNLGLTLPVGTENVSRTVINGNNTLIDTFAGNVNTAMDQMGSNLGILETGDTATHSIAKGEYVTWKGASYTADAAISIGETLAATGGSKNLTACDKGIANALNSKVDEYGTFSDDETVCGTWIDGRPIYRKMFHFQNTFEMPSFTLTEVNITINAQIITDVKIFDVNNSCFVGFGTINNGAFTKPKLGLARNSSIWVSAILLEYVKI